MAELDNAMREHYAKTTPALRAAESLTRASRLGASGATDTLFVGYKAGAASSVNYWSIGTGPARAFSNWDGIWDFERYNCYGGRQDSLQGWVTMIGVNPGGMGGGTDADNLRPWDLVSFGNRINKAPVQGRTMGVISAWHVDPGRWLAPTTLVNATPWWYPLGGSASAWCGLRAGQDNAIVDLVANGGTGNAINGECLFPRRRGSTSPYTQKLFPGYAMAWDQMLYRDLRVASSTGLTISFKYQTRMDTRAYPAINGAEKGWFMKDDYSTTEGEMGAAIANNLLSETNSGGTSQPADSFMVYVGAPTDPTSTMYSDGNLRPIYDLKRRWFSEVIKIDKPFFELMTRGGNDSTYRATPKSIALPGSMIDQVIAGQGSGGGIIRVVFRSKTNYNYGDEQGTGGSFNSRSEGAVRIDDVALALTDPPYTTLLSSDFELASDINNTIEGPNSGSPGPAVLDGYALNKWHGTGRPPGMWPHLHPIDGGGGYAALSWLDVCGHPGISKSLACNMSHVVVSMGEHPGETSGGSGATGLDLKENAMFMASPAILLAGPYSPDNVQGIDLTHANNIANARVRWDFYSGATITDFDGNVWGLHMLAYPTLQTNNVPTWGDVTSVGFWGADPPAACFIENHPVGTSVKTSNTSGVPDSVKFAISRESWCTWIGVDVGCNSGDGSYVDNCTFILPPGAGGDKVGVDIWDWYNDTFPANETKGYPGVAAAFDTCGALIRTPGNNAVTTGDADRFCISGDTVTVQTTSPAGVDVRCDMVFRIYPGPGNYMILGNKASGLRAVPQVASAAGPGSFWYEYMQDNGAFGTGGNGVTGPGHGGSWNPDIWNSARLDTAETLMFPCNGRGANLDNLRLDRYDSEYMEDSDVNSKYQKLGFLHNKCFLVDTLGAIADPNIYCPGTTPPYLDPVTYPGVGLPYSYSGYDGQPTTKEHTKVIPDGLLTAGSHVQYFFRFSRLSNPLPAGPFVMTPDTNRICPQFEGLSQVSTDSHRWQQFGVLPDRWKDTGYGGFGTACMLVIDADDRRGTEQDWTGAADSIGATDISKMGGYNGWHCTGAYVSGDGSHNYFNDTGLGALGQYVATNPMGAGKISIWKHSGNAGTIWDLYNVHEVESGIQTTAHIGVRGANRGRTPPGGYAGRYSLLGPTPQMLAKYYNLMFNMSGTTSGITMLGPVSDGGWDDVTLITDWLNDTGDHGEITRGFWAMGYGFAEGLKLAATTDDHGQAAFMANVLGIDLRDPSYFSLANTNYQFPDLMPVAVICPDGQKYAAQNSCQWTLDVLDLATTGVGSTASTYQDMGTGGTPPFISGILAPKVTPSHPYVTLTDAWASQTMYTRFGGNTWGRLQYFSRVLVNVFGSICTSYHAVPIVDVPQNTARTVDFLGNVWGNPMVAGGKATVHFGLAKSDRVEVKVYDVTGRLVRNLADRNFQAGEHSLTWDGTNDQGQAVARGVYFTQVKYINSRFVDAKKLTVLK